MILFIDTATEQATLVLHSGGKEAIKEFANFPASEQFPALVQKFLQQHRATLADLTQIAVRVGPGSFSRIRTGVVAANALAYGLGIGVVGVTTDPDFDWIRAQKGERMVAPVYNAEPTITISKKKRS